MNGHSPNEPSPTTDSTSTAAPNTSLPSSDGNIHSTSTLGATSAPPSETLSFLQDSQTNSGDGSEEVFVFTEADAQADTDLGALLAQLAHAEDIARGAEGRLDTLIAELDGMVSLLESQHQHGLSDDNGDENSSGDRVEDAPADRK